MAIDGWIKTGHGRIAVSDSGGGGPAILMIHGNSSGKAIFARQFSDPALSGFRLVAFDLPGHGASDDAIDPSTAYTFGGYSEVAEAVIRDLGLSHPVLLGWSLGGHIALETLGRGNIPLAGVMITGTPPVKPVPESLFAAFVMDPAAENLTGKRDFTEENAIAYATHTSAVDGVLDPSYLDLCRRTDGRARETMFGSVVGGQALDETAIVAETSTPLAVVNGRDDAFIHADYFDTLRFGSLWSRGVVRLHGAAHAPFLQRPREFNTLLREFANACHGVSA